jgi:hypothetical protein
VQNVMKLCILSPFKPWEAGKRSNNPFDPICDFCLL